MSDTEPEETQLCTSCGAPNSPSAHFCVKCGAPLSSYACMGPYESIFAEGFIYRQAAERPRSLIVVVGIWIIFGLMAAVSVVFLFTGDVVMIVMGAFALPVSLIMLWRTTKNYLTRKKINQKGDA